MKEDAMGEIAKESVYITMGQEINSLFKDQEEARKVEEMLLWAEEQSRKKIIRTKKQKNNLRKMGTLWKIRFKYGIHWKKTLYPFRLARNIFMGKLYHLLNIQKSILRGIEFAGTYRCNFNCNHCLCARIEESSSRREMEPEDYARVVDEAMKLGCVTFGLEGGEPFVSPVWDKIIEACKPGYNHIIISTNGFLFDDKKARRCSQLGVDTINFSLDSGVPELHDLFRRRRGSYEKVIKGIELCRRYGIKVIINTVVHKGNLYTDHFRELLDFCEEEKIMINTLFAKGVGNFKDKEVILDENDLKAYEKLIEPYNYVQRHLNHNYGKQWGCPGTKEMINMTPYGDVINCANMHIYFGNVMEEPLEVIRERALSVKPFGQYRSCFLAEDKDFMAIYYPALEEKGYLRLDEFESTLKSYEKKHNKVLYGD